MFIKVQCIIYLVHTAGNSRYLVLLRHSITVAIVYAIRLALSEVDGGATIPVTEFETTSAVLNRHDSRPITLRDYPLRSTCPDEADSIVPDAGMILHS